MAKKKEETVKKVKEAQIVDVEAKEINVDISEIKADLTEYMQNNFFEYNDYAINVLKEAGFTMAFAGGRQKIKVGSDKMKLPRYGVINTFNINNFINMIY